jgi:uncharacterized protein with GYD domain
MGQSTERARRFAEATKKNGVTVEAQYWTLGRYDGVLILAGAKPNQLLHCLAELVSAGYVKTHTLQVLTDKEFDAVVEG